VLWLLNRPGASTERIRTFFLRALPETGGRGLWGSAPRRRLIRDVVAHGDASRLMDARTHLILSACAVDSGHMCYFVNWDGQGDEFMRRVDESVGELVTLTEPREVIEAAVASSAIPAVFEPVRIRRRDFVDGGVFSNQPLRIALADDADALLVVLVSPSGGLPPLPRRANLFELSARLVEIANWRDLETELRSLPPGWLREEDMPSARQPSRRSRARTPQAPARVCVVEPETRLQGGLYGFSPENTKALIERGEADAWAALERAGWLAADA
jgi:predicted acylesterase/phospholipase RssA